jgi:hypothetical protein
MNPRRFLVTVPGAVLLGAAVVSCGHGSTPSSVPTAFTPPASYTAQASAAASAASSLATRCQPKGQSVQAWEVSLLVHKSARQAFYTCEAIPKADDSAVAACALTAAENAHKATGTSSSKEAGFIGAMALCVSNLGASPSAAPTPTATVTG